MNCSLYAFLHNKYNPFLWGNHLCQLHRNTFKGLSCWSSPQRWVIGVNIYTPGTFSFSFSVGSQLFETYCYLYTRKSYGLVYNVFAETLSTTAE